MDSENLEKRWSTETIGNHSNGSEGGIAESPEALRTAYFEKQSWCEYTLTARSDRNSLENQSPCWSWSYIYFLYSIRVLPTTIHYVPESHWYRITMRFSKQRKSKVQPSAFEVSIKHPQSILMVCFRSSKDGRSAALHHWQFSNQ